MTRDEPCPEALYGQHGEANTVGKCPYCGAQLRAPGRGVGRPYPAPPLDETHEHRHERLLDPWGHRDTPADPYDPDIESAYYEE